MMDFIVSEKVEENGGYRRVYTGFSYRTIGDPLQWYYFLELPTGLGNYVRMIQFYSDPEFIIPCERPDCVELRRIHSDKTETIKESMIVVYNEDHTLYHDNFAIAVYGPQLFV